VFDFVEWVAVVVFSLEYLIRFYAEGENGEAKGRIRFLFSFFGVIDLVSIVPFFVDVALPDDDLPALQWVRTLRFFRIMHVEGRFLTAFSTFKDIFHEKGRVMLTTGFLGFALWLVVSALYYLSEKNNPQMLLTCGTVLGFWRQNLALEDVTWDQASHVCSLNLEAFEIEDPIALFSDVQSLTGIAAHFGAPLLQVPTKSIGLIAFPTACSFLLSTCLYGARF
jgi:voltage-gated potassium channel